MMKTDLPCYVVRDLLPSYIEGLTEKETAAAVKAHLDGCEVCRSRYAGMSEESMDTAAEEKEVDYLKQVRKKNKKRIIVSVFAAVLLVLGVVGGKLFLIGTPCGPESLAVTPTLADGTNHLRLELFSLGSAKAILGVNAVTTDGVTSVSAREGLVSPFDREQKSGSFSMELPLDGISRVEVCGMTVWQEGLIIDGHTNRLMDSKVPYVGDAPAVGHLISNLDLDFPSTMELQTAQPPYGLTIHFTEALDQERYFIPEQSAFLLLALVGNLEVVTWDDPSGYHGALTLSQANEGLKQYAARTEDFEPLNSVKEYGQNVFFLQTLRNLLHI